MQRHYKHIISRCFSLVAKEKPKRQGQILRTLNGEVDTSSEHFQNNLEHSKSLAEKYKQVLSVAEAGGGEKGKQLHVVRNKKILIRDRLKLLLDEDSEFLELSPLAGMGMEYGDIPCASNVNGIGKIHGRWCMVLGNDATTKGGTIFPISIKKNLRSQKIAEENMLPCVYIVDSGGAFLPLQSDIFPDRDHGGQNFNNEAVMSSKGIPQVAIVCGSCTAGGAYVPTMATEAVIVHKIGTIFLGGPPLVYAALGEVVSQEDLGGGMMHSSVSGCTDYYEKTEEDAFQTGRDIIACLNIDEPEDLIDFEDPLYNINDIPGIIPVDNQHNMDIYKVLSRLVDGSRFHEYKALYGPTLVTGFAFIHGHLTGILGNNQGSISEQAALKATNFIQLCRQRRCPIIFLQNTTPEQHIAQTTEAAIEYSKRVKAQAAMMSAVACADVPKITIIIGNSYGAENYAMAGRSMSPSFLFVWPNARTCLMQEELLGQETVQLMHPEDEDQVSTVKSKVLERVAVESSSFHSSGRVWDDGIILPQDTRKVLAQCLSIVTLNMDKQNSFSNTRDPIFKM
ncbi:unnamed protein product [Owenia fusiformis]|uniref:methylcrotonoyl-CoA carboxylase n=1 Tax=Owenia fusiformis TaxID=6347 RepID=A0A8S4MX12_OWEFU|nr:unnamed protein product [Owenia fusiformis]